ncbi:uncharacterized protein BP01DRAFT_339161 [Aspergillus saccharolyticus JOP 1030-1]|uniref:F-box domain-containing protein n=1 Tax=Aspergillus saccharolyticus JOP 1030-1 TaxID=1450539 RepID=A0A318ZGN3_9EURO|nr:hypothetical protein BP01DRAFT_339161 [Aspergillus saccharolyticus JOP 1030-1]PYH45907.1 hypothetical protein BP01DRAFT_339161 [Aspergillus saccharolyticus JOP 1030-1]
MTLRGLWNLHSDQQWYRLCHRTARIDPPDSGSTLQMLEQLRDSWSTDSLGEWEAVPFRSPIHTTLDYVYTVDRDTGIFTISLWGERAGSLMPACVRVPLAAIDASCKLSIQYPLRRPERMFYSGLCESIPTNIQPIAHGPLELNCGSPSQMNVLQEHLFSDFVFAWRYYIDDPSTWSHDSPVFRVLSVAFLRLAAWDFEVSRDGNPDLPISFKSIPKWKYPEKDIFWFHGFLIVLQEDADPDSMIGRTLSKTDELLGGLPSYHTVRYVLFTPHHITLMERSNGKVSLSQELVLLDNRAGVRCTPGFRVLSRILTSGCWKKPQADREKWNPFIPPEILTRILHQLEPRDTVALAQASLKTEQCYYATLPQLTGINVQDCGSSIPCCGQRGGLNEPGYRCPGCFAWQHWRCASSQHHSSLSDALCTECDELENDGVLDPGGINRYCRRKHREDCQIRCGGGAKSLRLRLSPPAHLRPELRFNGRLNTVGPSQIDYTITFNGSFSGLAYGVDP